MLSKGRFDVTVWNKRAEPNGLIEVKTSVWGFKSLERDLNRLCATLEKAKMIRWGLVAYFLSYSDSKQALAKDRVKRASELNFQNAVSHLEESRNKVNHHRGSIRTDGDSAWTAEVLEVVRR
ncbi:MAG: hypothetical protein F4227_07370 [Gammaproteobacteria bacterium]|nr:hypothetical protein [Gammaproteobacteria bacterium]MYF02773.1 hypothetical protein [Gammaproteobacteria bacterium]MYI77590.1 hypothetical protein [Gammaproteobacteria bacterium]